MITISLLEARVMIGDFKHEHDHRVTAPYPTGQIDAWWHRRQRRSRAAALIHGIDDSSCPTTTRVNGGGGRRQFTQSASCS
jgi:hypothetical protein